MNGYFLGFGFDGFSSCDSTDAANLRASAGVGALRPASTSEASFDSGGEDCFFVMSCSTRGRDSAAFERTRCTFNLTT